MNSLLLSPSASPINASITVPGSKSYTNRALVMAALAHGESILKHISLSDDAAVMMSALQKLGVGIKQEGDTIIVQGRGGDFTPYRGEIDVGAAGTSMRFLASLCCLVEGGDMVLRGSERMHERPIRDLAEALQSLGISIEYLGKDGCPPLRIRSKKEITKNHISINGAVSSQFITSLLLVSPLLKNGLTIQVKGEQISKSYLEMTFDSMRQFGVTVRNNDFKEYRVEAGQKYKPNIYTIEPDMSGTSYFFGIAAITGGSIKISNINLNSKQGDLHFAELLEKMGCEVIRDEENGSGWIKVKGSANLKGIECDMGNMPDTAQTLAVIAATAQGETYIKGLSTLKSKETDRLQALQNELRKLGIESEIGNDFIRVHGGQIHGATIDTYKDHRMAMSFAMLGSRFEAIRINDPGVVGKSFPDYWNKLEETGIRIMKTE